MTPRQIAFLFSFPANSKSLPAHAPATNNRTVCRNHFNPYLFIYKLYCFLFLLNPWRSEDDAERTRSFEKVTIVDDVRVVYTTVLMRFEKVDAVARCVYCVCVLGRPVCVFAWLFGYEIFTQKRGEKKLEAGSPSSSPPTVLFIQESHFERLGEKETTWHTQSTTRKKKRFFKKSEIKKRSSVYYKRVGILSLLLLHAARELKLKRRRNVFVPHFGWWLVFFFFISNLF